MELFFVEDVIELLEDMLGDNELDLIRCNKIHETKAFEYVMIAAEKLLLAASPEHPLIANAVRGEDPAREWIDLRLFEAETFILQRLDQTQRNLNDMLMKKLKASPSRTIEVQNIEASARMPALGIGVSFALETYTKYFRFEQEPRYFNARHPPRTAPTRG